MPWGTQDYNNAKTNRQKGTYCKFWGDGINFSFIFVPTLIIWLSSVVFKTRLALCGKKHGEIFVLVLVLTICIHTDIFVQNLKKLFLNNKHGQVSFQMCISIFRD